MYNTVVPGTKLNCLRLSAFVCGLNMIPCNYTDIPDVINSTKENKQGQKLHGMHEHLRLTRWEGWEQYINN